MIKAHEIRIGNLIHVKHPSENETTLYETQVKGITEDEILTDSYGCVFGTCNANFNDSYPIPLTEEWLFRLTKTNKYPHKFHNGFLELRNGVCFFKYHEMEIELPYIQQFQNLYFALTGQELELYN